jgi:methylenetetrahydrofolate dehydrogenase (NADP+)/methenyltetrahydrofolate cyclohydrolase
MTAKIIDGKAIAQALRDKVKVEVEALEKRLGRKLGLAVVLVGNNPASEVYVRNKTRASEEVGIQPRDYKREATTSEAELLGLIAQLNADDTVDGILVQLPLPDHIDSTRVLNAIDPAKDVDGFHPTNAGYLATGLPAIAPGTPSGCVILAKSVHLSLSGMEAVIVGRSNIVGRPLAQLLLYENATVTVAHSRTKDLAAVCRRADLLFVAIGRPEFVRKDWIKPGATVIDVGINRIDVGGKSKIVGDVAFEEAKEVAGAITPVPGGVGPMTIACLLSNTLYAAATRGRIRPAVLHRFNSGET